MDLTTIVQPSTATKSANLNGIETTAGGNIIIPVETSTQETSMSITRKGSKIWKPIKNATFISLNKNAGANAFHRTSS